MYETIRIILFEIISLTLQWKKVRAKLTIQINDN